MRFQRMTHAGQVCGIDIDPPYNIGQVTSTRYPRMTRKKLPIGIQSFRKIREDNYYYVDKIPFALRLIEEGSHYFLSRPRRFGKSLLLDTLGELFAANEPLFRGLYAHSRWDWSRPFPVIRISFAEGVLRDRGELDQRIRAILANQAEALQLNCGKPEDITTCFAELLQAAHAATGERVVVLI
ncbi:MAG: AAA family ATPase, partial [Methylococcus sp.]